jgi:GntR family transcriptional regulator
MVSRGRRANAGRSAREGAKAPPFMTQSVPLYYQLGSVLREKIVSGELAPGDRIPTEAELSLEYGVSRITVRQALAAMEEDGLIRREAGRGTFVTEHASYTETMKMEGSLDDLISMGLQTEVRFLELRSVQATPEQARTLDVAPQSPLLRCTRLRLHRDEPFSYVVILLPDEIGKRIPKADWKKGVILRVLEDKLGLPITDADQTVRAAMADAQLAQLLGTRIGAPLLSVDRVVRTTGGKPVESVHTFYRSDIYSLKVHLVRAQRRDSVWSLREEPDAAGSGSAKKETR